MTCCSTFVSGFAAAVAFIAFVFDIVLFFIAKARISKIGSAQIGVAVWLTLAAWVLLFFSGFFYCMGRCCISRRPRGGDGWGSRRDNNEETLRLDAVRAEAERKALQAKPEGGLPAFHEYQPLTARVDGDAVYLEPYSDSSLTSSTPSGHAGYAPAPQGTKAIDEYYTPSANAYQPSQHSSRRRNSATTVTTSSYPPTVPATSPPPQQAYLDGHPSAQPQTAGGYQNTSYDPYNASAQAYNHGQQASSCKYHHPSNPNDPFSPSVDSTTPIHLQQPSSNSNYSQYNDPYASRLVQHQASYQSVTSNTGSYFPVPATAPQPHRNYSLGGAGSPPHPEAHQPYQSPIIPPVNTNVGYVSPTTSPVRGPRSQPQPSLSATSEEPPPGYDDGPGHWAH